jgi:hypothetical protein
MFYVLLIVNTLGSGPSSINTDLRYYDKAECERAADLIRTQSPVPSLTAFCIPKGPPN